MGEGPAIGCWLIWAKLYGLLMGLVGWPSWARFCGSLLGLDNGPQNRSNRPQFRPWFRPHREIPIEPWVLIKWALGPTRNGKIKIK